MALNKIAGEDNFNNRFNQYNVYFNGQYIGFKMAYNFKVMQKAVAKAESIYSEIGFNYGNQVIYPRFKKYIKTFIEKGGSEQSRFAWGYWRSKNGEKLTYISGVKLKKVIAKRKNWALPVHINTYKKLRKLRWVPKPNQFAMVDTHKLIDSFTLKKKRKKRTEAELQLGFKGKYERILNKHENGIGVPKRQIMMPVQLWYEESYYKKDSEEILKKVAQAINLLREN